METLPGRRDDLPLRGLHWSLHRAGEFRDGARVVAVREEKLVRAVVEVVVREGLEEFNGFHVMVVPTSRRWGPAGPVHGNIFGVTLSKTLPQRTSGSVKPFLVQRPRARVSQRLISSRTVRRSGTVWRNTSLKPFSKRWRIASTRIPNGPGKPRPSRRKSS